MIENKSCPRCSSWFAVEQVDGDFSGICPRCLAGIIEGEPESPLKPGATFGGFEILDILGQGGMGVVYKARQTSLNRIVALKVLSPQTAGSKEFALRFDREAKVLASLNHPNVVQVHDFGRETDVPYLVMEYVDGETLESAMKRLDRPRLLEVIRDVIRGLRKVHEAGLIHRDLKPANIFVSRDGAAKIGDFGLAVRTESDCHVTEHGYFVGTPHYASPEHAQGSAIDARSDLYALGAILYEGFAGRPPFQAASPAQVLTKHVEEPAPALSGPPDVAALVRRLLEKDPAKRFASAAELEAALAKVSLAPAPSRRPWALAAAAALLVAVGSLFLLRPAAPGLPFLVAAGDALHDDDYAAAAKAVVSARRDPAWSTQAIALSERLATLRLAKQEEDLGHYYCFSKGEWEKGLPLIAAGEDSPYREAARKDMAKGDPAAIADAWLALVKDAKPRWAERMRERAWAWLDAAGNPRAAELDKTLEARREIDLLRLSPHLSQGRLRASELQSLPYLPPAAYDLEIEAEGELLVWLPGAGGRRVSGSAKLRVRDGRTSAGTPADLRVAEPRLFHVQGALTKLALRAVLTAPVREIDVRRPDRSNDLLALIDLKRDAASGTWVKKDGALFSSAKDDRAQLRLPLTPADAYELSMTVERLEGGGALNLGLVRGDAAFCVVVDGWTGDITGLELVDNRGADKNETTSRGTPFLRTGKPVSLTVSVHDGGVRLAVDGRAIFDWKGNPRILRLHHDLMIPGAKAFFLGSSTSAFKISRLTFTPREEVVDLLRLIDPARDAVKGGWELRDGRLVSGNAERAVLEIPYAPPGDYDFRVVFSRKGISDVNLILSRDGRPFAWCMGGMANVWSGFGSIKDVWAPEPGNPSRVKLGLDENRLYDSVVEVRNGGVRAFLNGKLVCEWKTDYRDLSLGPAWNVRDPHRLGLGTFHSPTTFHAIEVREVKSQAVNLLPLVNPRRDVVKGEWTRNADSSLVSPRTPEARIHLPVEVPAEYDLEITAERRSEDDRSFHIGLPVGGRNVLVTLDGFGANRCAFENVDGRPSAPPYLDFRGGVFPKTGVPVTVTCSVRRDGIRVEAAGRTILVWKGDARRLSTPADWQGMRPTAPLIGTFRSEFRVLAARLMPVGDSSVDLLAITDPARDAVAGRWGRSGQGLVNLTSDAFPRVLFPVKAPAEYDVELEVERKEGFRSLIVGLVSGESHFVAHIDGWTGTISGLDLLDNKGADQNETTTRDVSHLPLDKKVRVVASVRRTGVKVAVDGRVIIDWTGDARRLSMNQRNRPMPRPGLSIGAWDSRFLIHAATLTPR